MLRTIYILAAACLWLMVDSGGVGADDQAPPSQAGAGLTPAEVQVVVTVLWEGRDLQSYNLEALRSLRSEYPDLPLVHLISPGYFTRSGGDQERISGIIRSLIHVHDKVGLLLTTWRSQVVQAGSIFRGGPTLWGHELEDHQCQVDCGLDVPVTLYPQDEVAKMIIHGKVTLDNAGLNPVKAFAAQAHLADQNMFNVARSLNMDYDFSAVAPEILAPRIQHFPYYQWVMGLWGDVKVGAQPYVVATPAGAMITVPLAGGSLDYEGVGAIYHRFNTMMNRIRKEGAPGGDVFQIQLHQETANRFAPNLSRLLKKMYAGAADLGVKMTLTAYNNEPKTAVKSESDEAAPGKSEPYQEFYPREALSH